MAISFSMPRILIVDNEPNVLSVLSTVLKSENFDVVTTREGQKAIAYLREQEFDLLITDIKMEPVNGMEVLKVARAERPEISIIMFTAYATIETAIDAMKLGAFDYVTKPFQMDELLLTIQRALVYKKALSENKELKSKIITRYRFENIIAESRSMKDVCHMIERVAPTDTTVLIYGDSGTGKELVAKAIHAYSNRRSGKFLAVNCAALPEPLLESEMFGHMKGAFTGASSNKIGLFEACEGGTIFLDEIGAMPLSLQGKLLRVLQEKEVRRVGGIDNIPTNARVLAATNVKLEELIKSGKFREDLYYRLNVITLNVEPLRNRKEDILPLLNHFIKKEIGPERTPPSITDEVKGMLLRYLWPGNIRELENTVKHALTFTSGNEITCEVLPSKLLSAVAEQMMAENADVKDDVSKYGSLKDFLRDKEREYLLQVIESFGGDKEQAASALKISLATLYRKLLGGKPGEEEKISEEE